MTARSLLAGEYAVLGLLALRPMHGYDMMCVLTEEGLDEVCPVEQSTLYTYLRNVEARGLVDWTEERVGLRPPRKIHRLTVRGRDALDTWLRRPVDRMRDVRLEFLLKLYFLERLDGPARQRLLVDQLGACERYLARLSEDPGRSAFHRLVLQSRRSAAEATLAWLMAHAAEYDHAGAPA